MPGIVNKAAQQQPARQPKKPAPETPEVTRGVIVAKKIMAQPVVAKQLVETMRAAGDPATGIAQATIFIVKQLYEKSKGTLPTKAIVPLAQRVLVDVMRLGAAAGLFKITPDLLKQAVMIAVKMFTESVKQPVAQPAPAQSPASAAQPAAMPMPTAPMMGG